MSDLREQLSARNIDPSAMSDEQVREVAKALNIPLPIEVEVVEYKGAEYVKTSGFTVPHKDPEKRAEGKTQQARGLFLRKEALDPCIEALLVARGLLHADEIGEDADDE